MVMFDRHPLINGSFSAMGRSRVSAKNKLKAYPMGYFHIPCLFVVCLQTTKRTSPRCKWLKAKAPALRCIDRISRFAHMGGQVEVRNAPSRKKLKMVRKAILIKTDTLAAALTEEGRCFAGLDPKHRVPKLKNETRLELARKLALRQHDKSPTVLDGGHIVDCR